MRYLLSLFFVLLVSCTSNNVRVSEWGFPYMPSISQGSYLIKSQVEMLKKDMTKEEVNTLLGAPTILGFDNKWYYVYFDSKHKNINPRQLFLEFNNNLLVKAIGTAYPSINAKVSDVNNDTNKINYLKNKYDVVSDDLLQETMFKLVANWTAFANTKDSKILNLYLPNTSPLENMSYSDWQTNFVASLNNEKALITTENITIAYPENDESNFKMIFVRFTQIVNINNEKTQMPRLFIVKPTKNGYKIIQDTSATLY